MSNSQQLTASRGIPEEVFSALKNSIFPGAADASVVMAWDYCAARGLDILLKPVHLVPMFIKDKNNGDQGEMRDVVMPGIGLYRIQADRAGNYAGMSAPQFGPDVTYQLDGMTMTVPEWCEMTVSKIIGDRVVSFTAREYWIENYATAGRNTKKPNAMWEKRPRGQLAKCTEAQVLRKGWPELGAQATAEEMEGKTIEEKDITPAASRTAELPAYLASDFENNLPAWSKLIASGKKTAEQIIATVESKGRLSNDQKAKLMDVKAAPVTADAETGEEGVPQCTQEEFAAKLPEWTAVLQSGKRTAEQMIASIETKCWLTEAQKTQLRGIK